MTLILTGKVGREDCSQEILNLVTSFILFQDCKSRLTKDPLFEANMTIPQMGHPSVLNQYNWGLN